MRLAVAWLLLAVLLTSASAPNARAKDIGDWLDWVKVPYLRLLS